MIITEECINARAEIMTQDKAVNTEVLNKGLDFVVDEGIESAKEVSTVVGR
jgi:hypothetical protein